jgi:cell division transport system permease protein
MTFWVTSKRVARYGLLGFFRNGFVSLSAIFIMTITLFVASALIIFGAALNSVLKDLTTKVDITVYMMVDASDDQIQSLETSLKTLSQVSSVEYISRETALATFEERHKNDQLTLQALQSLPDNPLGASLEIRAKDPSEYAAISKYLDDYQTSNTSSGIDRINFVQNQVAIDRLTYIINASHKTALTIAIILGIASLLIAFNTIRLAIYIARDEISVMNIVGASHWFVRGPFVVSGFLYGVLSAIIVLVILYPLTVWLGPPSEHFFGTFNVYSYYISTFGWLALILVGTGALLGSASSYLAVRRYLQ